MNDLPDDFRKTLSLISIQLEDWFKSGQPVSPVLLENAIISFDLLPSPKDDRLKMRLEKLQLIFGKPEDSPFDFRNC
jgi:hypothetical protein